MNISAICVGGNYKSMISFQKSLRQLNPDLVRFRWRDLTRFEGLPYLIGNHFIFPPASCYFKILLPRQREFRVRCCCMTGKGRYQFAVPCLFRILNIVQPRFQRLLCGAPFVPVHRNDACRCHSMFLRTKKCVARRCRPLKGKTPCNLNKIEINLR